MQDLSKLDFVDSLRGIAAAYVVTYHLHRVPNPNLPIPELFARFIDTGWSGVPLFFVVSAFTLSLSMELRQGEDRSLANYYLRRFFRIAPLFYLWLLFMATKGGMWHDVYSLKRILLSLVFGFNFCPGQVGATIVLSGGEVRAA